MSRVKPTVNDIIKLCGDTYVSIVANVRVGDEWFENVEITSIQCGVDTVPQALQECTVYAIRNTLNEGMPVINSIDIVVQGNLELITFQIKGDCDEKGTKVQH